MPDYSEYIIKENNEVQVFANSRGDYTFLADVFLGPELIRAFIQRQSRSDQSIGDNAFSAVVLDFDRKELLVELYPSEERDGTGIFSRGLYLEFLAVRYPGWQVGYAENGWIDRQQFIKEKSPLQRAHSRYENEAWDQPRGTLISIKDDAGAKVFWNEQSVYELIPKGAQYVLEEKNHESVPDRRFPFGGVHVGLSDNEMSFWYFNPTPGAEDWARRFWNKYRVVFRSHRYQEHFDEIDIDRFQEIQRSGKSKALEILRDAVVCTYEEHSNRSTNDRRYSDELDHIGTDERRGFFESAIEELKGKGVLD